MPIEFAVGIIGLESSLNLKPFYLPELLTEKKYIGYFPECNYILKFLTLLKGGVKRCPKALP
jgi:hypothetical protein